MKPEVTEFHNSQIDGRIIDSELEEEYALNEYGDALEAYRAIHEPLVELTRIPIEERTEVKGNGAYDSSVEEPASEVRDLADAYQSNIRNAEVYFYLSLENGHKYQFEAVPRTDFEPEKRVKPPSFMELQYRPDKHESTKEKTTTKRLSLRYAMDFKEEFLDRIEGMPSDVINEIDLLTAFYREGGIHDQLDKSSIEFSSVVREDMTILQADQETVAPGIADETVVYVSEYLSDDFQDGGLSQDECNEAGKHIGTANALGLNFSHEREPEELFGSYSPRFGRSLVNIDPEGGVYTPDDQRELRRDRQLFVQQVTPMNDRTAHHEIESKAEDIVERAKDSSKSWDEVLDEQLPESWRNSMPEENFV